MIWYTGTGSFTDSEPLLGIETGIPDTNPQSLSGFTDSEPLLGIETEANAIAEQQIKQASQTPNPF